MRVCGFTFIRNAVKYGYQIQEAILSILPLCDHFVVAVGNSDDDTLVLIKSIPSDKIEIIETVWDDSLRKGGAVLAVETNKAFDAIKDDYDWCFYIQGDEVMHEQYIEPVRQAMERYKDDAVVEGLLFKYVHFYGTFDFVADSRSWYRQEIRIIRNNKSIRSFKDAQGFRINNRKLKVKRVDAAIYHYGWVRPPEKMQDKIKNFSALWHSDDWIEKNIPDQMFFDYSNVSSIKRFSGSHPKVMFNYISSKNWIVEMDENKRTYKLKDRILYNIEKWTGWRPFEYRNFELI